MGGTQIMYNNGVSHLTANDDLAGVEKIMEWLSYVPAKRGLPVPILNQKILGTEMLITTHQNKKLLMLDG